MSNASEQRGENQIGSLKDAEWNLDTLLELHYWLFHRSRKAQQSALEVLLEITDRNPKSVSVSPLDLLRHAIYPLAFGSGAAPIIFYSLAEHDTPAADEALKEISENKGVLYDPNVVDACTKLFGEKKFRFN